MKKDFLSTKNYSKEELAKIIECALEYKNGGKLPDYSDKILTLIFANPSLRTRLSFESGMKKMKGGVNVINAQDSWQFEYEDGVLMNENKQEHIKEAAKVLSAYSDVIGLRNCELLTTKNEVPVKLGFEEYAQDKAIKQLAKYATKPVINMESNMDHPCQAMADIMTMKEKFGTSLEGKKVVLTWVPHIKTLPLATPLAQLMTPVIFGMDVTLACPEGYELDPFNDGCVDGGGKFKVTHDQNEALKDADVVIAKNWCSTRNFGEMGDMVKLCGWLLDSQKMSLTNKAMFLHCLPVRRNIEVTDEVLDDHHDSVIANAENRMWVEMAIVSYLLAK